MCWHPGHDDITHFIAASQRRVVFINAEVCTGDHGGSVDKLCVINYFTSMPIEYTSAD